MKKLLLALSVILCITKTGLAQIDTNVVVYAWKLDDSYANRIRVDVDTALENSQQYNPIFRNSFGAATLGHFGLPSLPIVYNERPQNEEFVLINSFFPFMKLYDNTVFINTRKPFTKLTYINGGSNQSKEEIFDAFYSQNITKTLNAGLHYTTVGSLGQYKIQQVKNSSFNFFSSLYGKVYSYHLSVNYNKIVADENGGVKNDSLVTDTTITFAKDIPTLFGGTESSTQHDPDVYNVIKNLNILAVQEISFRGNRKTVDPNASKQKIRIFYPKLVYIFNLSRTVRLFTDKDPLVGYNSGLYQALNVSDSITRDSLVYWKMSNAARLQFQGKRNNHYFIDYAYELMNYSMSVNTGAPVNNTAENSWFITDEIKLPGLNYNSRLFNAYFSSGFGKVFADRLAMNLYGRYYLSGYRAGH
jgi:hypothetical protein